MKILCVSQRFFPVVGGAEKVAENLMDFLSLKHDVTVYTTNASDLNCFWDVEGKKVDSESSKNYKIKRYEILTAERIKEDEYDMPFTITSPGPFCPEMWNDLLNMTEKFDLIVATAFPYTHIIPAFLASKKFQIPLLLIPHLHLEFPESYFTGLWLSILDGSDMIIVNTSKEKQYLLKYFIPEDKIIIIPPGMDFDAKEGEIYDMRKYLQIDQNSLIIFFAGSKSYEKGITNLIESLKKLWDGLIGIELVLIGPSTNYFQKYYDGLNDRYKKHVHDLGIVSDQKKENLFSSCDIFVMPSKSESFGITYLEAWKYQKPVIGCNIEAVSEVIDNNVNGYLVEFGDVEELTNSIKKLQDPKIRKELGKNGFVKLHDKYDLQKNCKKFEEICLSLKK